MGSALAAAIDELVGSDPSTMSDPALRMELFDLRRQLDRLEHRYAALLAVAERRMLAYADGHGSTPAWAQAKTGTARRDANRALKTGLLMDTLPTVDKAWSQGEISTSAAMEIADGRVETHADVYAELEPTLVNFAAARQWRELRTTIAHYRSCCDALDDREPSDRNGLFLAKVQDRWSLDGDLDDLAGHTLDTALKAAMGKPIAGDDRTIANRRADAVVELARYYLDHGELPMDQQRAPHITIGVDLHTALEGLNCPQLKIWDGPTLSRAQLDELVCDAKIAPLITGGHGTPLHMGREIRDANRAQRAPPRAGTADAASRAVTGPPGAATPTTSNGGTATAPPTSET